MVENKKVLVTGGAGFIGSNLVDYLVQKRLKVYILDNLSTGLKENVNKNAIFYKADVTSPNIEKYFQKHQFDCVFHLASQIDVQHSIKFPLYDAKTNILGSINVFNFACQYGVKKIIFSSSGGAIYGECKDVFADEITEPDIQNPYGASKLAVETYLEYFGKMYNVDVVSLRYSNVYGPKQGKSGEGGVVFTFIDKILKREKVTINDGSQTRDFIFVGDVAVANFAAWKMPVTGIFNISSQKSTSIDMLFYHIAEELKYTKKPEFKDRPKGDVEKSLLCNELAKKELMWSPSISLTKGLHITILEMLKEFK